MSESYNILLEEASVQYGKDPALGPTNLTVSTSERIGIIGPNGAGKSTLLKLLSGQQSPTSGHAYIRGSGRNVSLGRDDPWAKAVLPFFRPDSVYLSEMANDLLVAGGDQMKVVGFLNDLYSLATKLDYSTRDAIHQFQKLRFLFDLNETAGRSEGERRAFEYAFRLAICAHYKMLFLDEPLRSLDQTKCTALESVMMGRALGTTAMRDRGVGFAIATLQPKDFEIIQIDRVLVVRDHYVVADFPFSWTRHWRVYVIKSRTVDWVEDVALRLRGTTAFGVLSEGGERTYRVITNSSGDENVLLERLDATTHNSEVMTHEVPSDALSCLGYLTNRNLRLIDHAST